MFMLTVRHSMKGCMKPLPFHRMLLLIGLGLVLSGALVQPCNAQWKGFDFGSFNPLASVEYLTGPILPKGGLASTFRSEVFTGIGTASVEGAKLVGSNIGEVNLRTQGFLDESPLKFDLAANVRIWRFGLRSAYTLFENRTKQGHLGKIGMSGISAGLDADILQHEWFAFGASIDALFINPRFQGMVHNLSTHSQDPAFSGLTLDVVGNRPVMLGAYLRYVPPEILNIPVHFEAYTKWPFKGSRMLTYGASLVFRPQIYRFDIAARFFANKTYLKFSTDPDAQSSGIFLNVPVQSWELDMEWNIYGVDLAVYF
jgi:hypothetical protein